MIIVEGPDGAGKSRLIQRLVGDIPNISISPRVVSKDTEAMVDLVNWTENNLAQGLQPVIHDRHRLISSPIYATVLRDYPDRGFEKFHWLSWAQRTFDALEPLIIWCLPPLRVVQDNVIGQEGNEVVAPYITPIYWLYHHRATIWGGPYIVWDYTTDMAEVQYKLLVGGIDSWLMTKGLR